MDYQKVLVAQPFITQTFTPSLMPGKVPALTTGKRMRRILCLGLSASGVNNFYANLSTKVGGLCKIAAFLCAKGRKFFCPQFNFFLPTDKI
jgi:hypothetical protein